MSKIVPTQQQRDLAETLSGYGIPQADIARIVGVSLQSLHTYFRDELDIGMAKANAFVAQNLYRQATKDDPSAVRAAIFWAKARMGWREVAQEVNVNVSDKRDVSPEERARAAALMFARKQDAERRPH